MKTLKTLLFALVMMMIATSCRTVKVLPSSNTIQKDSTYTKRTLQEVDTLKVLRKADTARVTVAASKLDSTHHVVKSKHATVTLRKKNGKIEADCKCDGLEQMVKLQRELIETYREKETKTENTTVIQESWWMGWLKPFMPLLIIAGLFLVFKNRILNPKN